MQEYIEKMKKNQEYLLEYIEGEENTEEKYQNLINLLLLFLRCFKKKWSIANIQNILVQKSKN